MKIIAKTQISDKVDEFIKDLKSGNKNIFAKNVLETYSEVIKNEKEETIVEWTASIFADWLDNLTIERINPKQ